MSNSNGVDVRRPSTAVCPRCRPGNVQSYSWLVLDGNYWASVLWCDTDGCRADIAVAGRAHTTRADAETDCLRVWSDRAGAEARVGSMAEESKRILSAVVELANGGAA